MCWDSLNKKFFKFLESLKYSLGMNLVVFADSQIDS